MDPTCSIRPNSTNLSRQERIQQSLREEEGLPFERLRPILKKSRERLTALHAPVDSEADGKTMVKPILTCILNYNSLANADQNLNEITVAANPELFGPDFHTTNLSYLLERCEGHPVRFILSNGHNSTSTGSGREVEDIGVMRRDSIRFSSDRQLLYCKPENENPFSISAYLSAQDGDLDSRCKRSIKMEVYPKLTAKLAC